MPVSVDNRSDLLDPERSAMGEMANFFCKLHLLLNFASETDKVMNVFENVLLTDEFKTSFAFNTSESGETRLVRTACKAYHVRGSDETGVASYFNSFLSGHCVRPMFSPFVGNRFNILFYNAAAV